jgi:two-component system, NarL family, response regulator DesR
MQVVPVGPWLRQPDPSVRPNPDEPGVGTGTPITVLLAVDMGLLRSALVSLLSEEHDIEVVAAIQNNDTVTDTAQRRRPQVVVMDVGLPSTRSLFTIAELHRRVPHTQIVALAPTKPGLVRRLLAAEVIGAVDHSGPTERLLEAIRGAATGTQVIDAALVLAALAVGPNPLTTREMEVLHLAADGASGPEIAHHLHLTPATVRNYLSHVITKTGARTRVDAVRIAQETGWI